MLAGEDLSKGTWQTAYYNLVDYGMCGGYFWNDSCACGQMSYWSWNMYCSYTYTGNTDPDTGLDERYCANCGNYFVWGETGEIDPYTCRYTGTFYVKVYTNDEVKLEISGDSGYESHEYLATSFTLDNPEGTCYDGFTVDLECRNCGATHTNREYWHDTYATEILELSDYGACGGKIDAGRCACGQETFVSRDITCENWNWGVESWSEEGEDGVIHRFQKDMCSDCGLTQIQEWYGVTEEGSCYGTQYYRYTFQLGTDLNKTFDEHWTYEFHDYTYSYALAAGSESCEDGIIVIGTCTRCGDKYSYNSDFHGVNLAGSIDLAAYGSVCGGSLEYYQCPCGQYGRYDFSDELACDLDQKSTDHWIDGVIDYVQQWTSDGWTYTHSNSYIFTCAVTDPTACGLKIRMSEYWLQEGCAVVEYQTWQLGYDETTGTCQTEFTVATGESRAYHDYVQTTASETVDGIEINKSINTCSACGSYYVYTNHYENGNHIKYEREAVNLLSNGDPQRRHEAYTYGVTNAGYNYITEQWFEVTYADGSTYWDQYTYTYDFTNGCSRTRTYTNSRGGYSTYQDNAHNVSWSTKITKEATCSQFGEYVVTYTCDVCGAQTSQYTYEIEPTVHDWRWNGTLQTYVCDVCGLENVNGASGSIVMEDLTTDDGTSYIIGYWNRGEVTFNPYVSVILEDSTDENNELVLTGITFNYLTVEQDGVTALTFDKTTAGNAAAAAVAEAGYTGSYAIRISFVPINSTDTLDYAITFDSVTT